MSDQLDPQLLVEEVFRITGKVLPLDDPLTLAAMFYAAQMRDAAKDAAANLSRSATGAASEVALAAREAVSASLAVADVARLTAKEAANAGEAVVDAMNLAMKQAATASAAAAKQAAADRRALADAVEARMQKCVNLASRIHSTDGNRLIPAWYALMAFFAGALLCAGLAWSIVGINSSTLNEIEVGRQLNSVWSSLDADLRKRLIEAIEKRRR